MEDRLVKRKVGSDVRSVWVRGRPQTGWMDGVKRALSVRGMSVYQGKMIVRDRSVWKESSGEFTSSGVTLGSYQVQAGRGHDLDMKWQSKPWYFVVVD